MKFFKLNETQIPALGFGTWQLNGDVCISAVQTALEIGFTHIDTADAYGNHKEVGQAIKKSNIKREDLFLTSKIWYTNLRYQEVIDTCKRNLEELDIPYIDLYLIHWPNRKVNIRSTIEAFESLKKDSLIRNWGVSNFNIHHLQDCLDLGFKPANNQVEFHPSFNQKDLKEFCDANNIVLTAYSPLGQGLDLKIPLIQELGIKYNKSSAQVIVNWLISKGIVAIPKATTKELITQNFDVFGFELSPSEIEQIDNLDINKRLLDTDWSDFNY